MKRLFPLAIALALVACSNKGESLNEQAAKEYLNPIRPGYLGANPYWNAYSNKFIFAPAFDFKEVEGAAKYRYTAVQPVQDTSGLAERWIVLPPYEGEGQKWEFTSSTPHEALSEVWNEITPGWTELRVEALDAKGQVLGLAGRRVFLRDFPFEGPYNGPARDYRDAAIRALVFVHNLPYVQHWKDHTTPDMTYPQNAYVCKVVGATVRIECLLATLKPELKEEALAIAKNAAAYLIATGEPETSFCAYFPPTYGLPPSDGYGQPARVQKVHQGKSLLPEPTVAVNAFLDMYNATGDKSYYNRALKMMEGFRRLQREDGYFPTKFYLATGETINPTPAIPNHLFSLIRRFQREYDVHDYDEIMAKGEAFIKDYIATSFDLTGMFEDSMYDTLEPYSNITNFTAAIYATWLLSHDNPSEEDIALARDLVHLAEDQLVHWDVLKDASGSKPVPTPSTNEQYFYEVPVDDSSANVAEAYLALYKVTGDKLAFAKAKALMDEITLMQNGCNGQIPTTWEYNPSAEHMTKDYWLNGTWWTCRVLFQMAEYQ